MSKGEEKAWRCSVCGYVHRGGHAPEFCPVCGAEPEEFDVFSEEPAHAGEAAPSPGAPSQWQCLLCNHLSDGTTPPDCCPVCGAEAECFEAVHIPEHAGHPVTGDERIVVIGAGIAGVTAVESIVKLAPNANVCLLSRERALPYYRLNLTRYLAGDIRQEELPIHSESWYDSHGVQLELGADASRLDLEQGHVALRDGRELPFDKLVLAVGSHPFIPPIPGTDLDGVVTVRTTTDVEALLDGVDNYSPCICIGGGVLGIETAGALAKRGTAVTLLESHEWLMPRQLTRKAAKRLEDHVKDMGIRLRKRARTVELLGKDRVEGVRLGDGSTLRAGIVVIATGVRPNTSLARQADLEVNKGIVVDNHLRTSDARIFAAGDTAEHNGVLYGIWGASLAQGAIAGINAAGGDVTFGGLPRSNTLKVLGVDMLSIGQFEPEDGSYWVVEEDSGETFYHFVFRDGLLKGAILIGDTASAVDVRKAVEKRVDFSGVLRRNPGAGDIVDFLG